jgi:hypothetical protein
MVETIGNIGVDVPRPEGNDRRGGGALNLRKRQVF